MILEIITKWVKNRTWGLNPHTIIKIDGLVRATAKVSGCGYDKHSASVAEALEQVEEIMDLLRQEFFRNKEKFYGIGERDYGAIYLDKGVGMSCVKRWLESIGFKVIAEHSDKLFDYIILQKEG